MLEGIAPVSMGMRERSLPGQRRSSLSFPTPLLPRKEISPRLFPAFTPSLLGLLWVHSHCGPCSLQLLLLPPKPSWGGKAPSCQHQHPRVRGTRGPMPQNGQNLEGKAQHLKQGAGGLRTRSWPHLLQGFIDASAWVGARVCPKPGWRGVSPLVASPRWWEVTWGVGQGLLLQVDHKALHL